MGRIRPKLIAGSPLMVIGENPNRLDITNGVPFTSGEGEMIRKILGKVGIDSKDVSFTYFHLEDGYGSVDKMFKSSKRSYNVSSQGMECLRRIEEEIDHVNPRVILALGKYSHWAVTGSVPFDELRGYPIRDRQDKSWVITTYDPDALRKNYSLTATATFDIKKVAYLLRNPDYVPRKRALEVIDNHQRSLNIIQEFILEQKPVALDLEAMIDFAHITHVGLSNNPDVGYSFPVPAKRSEGEETEFWTAIARLMTHNIMVFCNAAYDMANLYNWFKIWPAHYEDIQLMAHVSHIELPKSLEYLASIYLMTDPWKFKSGIDMGIYNAEDAAVTIEIYNKITLSEAFNMQKSIYAFEMSQIAPATFMHLRGLGVDVERLASYKESILKRKEELLTEIKDLLIENNVQIDIANFNPNSSKQVARVLYGHLGFKVKVKRNTSGNYTESTDMSSLRALARETGNKIPALIADYRALIKRLSTYTSFPLTPEGRVHSSYNIGGTTTGRWSSSDSIIIPSGPGSLQTVVHEVRHVFREKDTNIGILQLDYAQAEAVIVAWLADDTFMKSIFLSRLLQGAHAGNDVHILSYSRVSGIPPSDVTKAMRAIGKTLQHAINYDAGPATVADRLGLPIREASELYKKYKKSNLHITTYHESIRRRLYHNRSLVTPLGRYRLFLDRPDSGDCLRSAFAFIPQSTIGDLLNKSMVEIFKSVCNKEVQLWTQLHDALYLTCPKAIAHEVAWECYKRMIHPLYINGDLAVVDVDYSFGDNWGKRSDENPDGQVEFQFDVLRKRDYLSSCGWFAQKLLSLHPYPKEEDSNEATKGLDR